MKKIIIATSVLFAFSSVFAQKPNVKPEVTKYQSKTSDAKPSSKPAPVSIQAKPNAKPVGKPAPVVSKVSPIKPTKSMAPSKNRAAASSNVNTARPEKASKNRAASSSAVNTSKPEKASKNRAASSSAVNTSKPEKASKNRAAASSAVGTDNKNPSEKLDVQSSVVGSSSAVVGDSKSPEMDADYCKGWNDGFSKAIPEGKKARVAKCEMNGTCKGYKCGYEAGMKKAELMFK